MLKANILLEEIDLYESEEHIMIPECMKRGSVHSGLNMMKLDEAYGHMMGQHLHDVQHHFMSMRGPFFRDNCGPGKRIINVY